MFKCMDNPSTSGQTASGQSALDSAQRGQPICTGFEVSACLSRSAGRKAQIPSQGDGCQCEVGLIGIYAAMGIE